VRKIQKFKLLELPPCMPAAYFFLLFTCLLSLETSHRPHQQYLTLPVLPPRSATVGGEFSKAATMGRHTSPEQKVFSGKASKLARDNWTNEIKSLVEGVGIDTYGLTATHGGLALGAYAGLWTYNVASDDFHASASALLAFEDFANNQREQVCYKLCVCRHFFSVTDSGL
jgi:hypothetical protein